MKIKYPIWLAPNFGVVMEKEVITETSNGYTVEEEQVKMCRDGKMILTANKSHVPKAHILEVIK